MRQKAYNVGNKFRKEYFGKKQKIFVTNLLKNKKVKLILMFKKPIRYGRILAYAYSRKSHFYSTDF